MKNIIYLFFILTLQFPLYSQSLSGNIKSDLPIPFASISVNGKSIGTASNADGFFEINDIKEGSYEFIFSAIGFKKLKKNISIQSGKNTLDIILEPLSYDIEQVVVTGTMKETFLSASPIKMDVVNQKFLNKIATNNVMEVIENVNGLQKQINCGVCGTNDIHINLLNLTFCISHTKNLKELF